MDATRGLPMDALDKRVHDSRPSRVHSLILKIFKIFGNFSKFFPKDLPHKKNSVRWTENSVRRTEFSVERTENSAHSTENF